MKPTVAQITAGVAEVFEIHPADITGPSCQRIFTRPRSMVCALSHEVGYPYTVIGRRLNRDHSSILNAVRKASEFCALDPEYRAIMEGLRNRFVTIPKSETASAIRDRTLRDEAAAAIRMIEAGHKTLREICETIITKLDDRA